MCRRADGMGFDARGDPVTPAKRQPVRGLATVPLVALLAGFALGGCGVGGSSGCSEVVGELVAGGSSVADAQGPLADACQDYREFVDAYDALPEGEGPGLAPGFVLIFCAPFSEPETPTSVYNSELCKSARASDPDLPSLR